MVAKWRPLRVPNARCSKKGQIMTEHGFDSVKVMVPISTCKATPTTISRFVPVARNGTSALRGSGALRRHSLQIAVYASCALWLAGSFGTACAAEFKVERDAEGVTVSIDGKLFTRYVTRAGFKPILWPIVGPTGKEMTRAWPMRDGNADEKQDHVHQKSFWFTHGSVNGVSFWDENKGHGEIVHRDFVRVTGGAQATIVTRNDWLGPDGAKICRDERTLVFHADETTRSIDFQVTVFADDKEVVFGDTKEGSFGLRTAGTVDVDKKLGGRIVNAEGLMDAAAWGKASPWVDYYGPIGGETLGIAILNHPTSFRYPTHWHVRTYGLFAANPFGLHDFYNDKAKDGSHWIKPGESMTLRYRVVFHSGDAANGNIAERFNAYAKENVVKQETRGTDSPTRAPRRRIFALMRH